LAQNLRGGLAEKQGLGEWLLKTLHFLRDPLQIGQENGAQHSFG